MVYVDPKGLRKYDKKKLHDFESVLKSGEEDKGTLAAVRQRVEKIDGVQLCSFAPQEQLESQKGVVPTHKAIIGASMAAVDFDQFNNKDSILSYLPMAWVGDFMISVGLGMAAGGCINCPEVDTMQPDLRAGPSFSLASLWEGKRLFI